MDKKKKKNKTKAVQKPAKFNGDGRRKHRHWEVTIFYHDGNKFARVYIDRQRAERFAERQKRSPVVQATRIREVN